MNNNTRVFLLTVSLSLTLCTIIVYYILSLDTTVKVKTSKSVAIDTIVIKNNLKIDTLYEYTFEVSN